MKQVIQSLQSGSIEVVEVPCPAVRPRQILIRSTRTLVSSGTERMLIEFGKANWLEKARQQPEKVRMVLEKARIDGVAATIEAVRSKLEQPFAPGYCNVGVVTHTGPEVEGIAIGDRVVSNGRHAEMVCVPKNLCARIPDSVSDDDAAFAVLGAVALQGIRLARPTLGECFVVIGLGLVGLITVQLMRAHGCRVLGIDPDPAKTQVAKRFGAEVVSLSQADDVIRAAEAFSRDRGVDGVLIAAATKSSEPVSEAARMCRKRGRIVLIGSTGLELNRADFYEKELSFQVSCSYGPGRYDPEYEEKGIDYPLGFVRWTEQRNFEAVLDMMDSGRLDVHPLISHRFPIGDAPSAYGLLMGSEPHLGILLDYPTVEARDIQARTVAWANHPRGLEARSPLGVAIIGAGNHAGRVLIPAFAATEAILRGIASHDGVTAAHYGNKYGFARATTDTDSLINAEDVDAVVIATRHDSHGRFAVRALQARKHVFVEKPLAITSTELDAIVDAWEASGPVGRRPHVMVGFNRRFAPHVIRMKALLDGVNEPKSFIVTVNAGAIPGKHWTHDTRIGGGRIIGEACHFVDLLRYLCGHPIVDWKQKALHGGAVVNHDTVAITLTFADGSWGAIHYLGNGHTGYPKERIEAFCAGRILQLDNFRRLRGYGWHGFDRMTLWRQDKGQKGCVQAFVDAICKGVAAPIPFDQLLEVGRITVSLGEAARG